MGGQLGLKLLHTQHIVRYCHTVLSVSVCESRGCSEGGWEVSGLSWILDHYQQVLLICSEREKQSAHLKVMWRVGIHWRVS